MAKKSKFYRIAASIFGLFGIGAVAASSTALLPQNYTESTSIRQHESTNSNRLYDITQVGYGTFKKSEPSWIAESNIKEVTELWELNVLTEDGTVKREVVTVLKSNYVSSVFDVGAKPSSGIYRIFVKPSADNKTLTLEAKARVSKDYIYVDMYKSATVGEQLTPNTISFTGSNVASFLSTVPWTTIWIAVGAGSGLLVLILIISLSIWGINSNKAKRYQPSSMTAVRPQRPAIVRPINTVAAYKPAAPAPSAPVVVDNTEKIEKVNENVEKIMTYLDKSKPQQFIVPKQTAQYMKDKTGQIYCLKKLDKKPNVTAHYYQPQLPVRPNIGYGYYNPQLTNQMSAQSYGYPNRQTTELTVGNYYRRQQQAMQQNGYYNYPQQQAQQAYNNQYYSQQQNANNAWNNQRQQVRAQYPQQQRAQQQMQQAYGMYNNNNNQQYPYMR